MIRLFLNEVSVYVKHHGVWEIMNEGASILEFNVMKVIIDVKGVLTCIHTKTLNEWMNDGS